MDGGCCISRPKFDVSFDRTLESLQKSINVDPSFQSPSSIVFPILLRPVFVNAAKKCGACVLQCDFEADDDIIVVAKKLNAYILSDDSDFFLVDVKFILFKTLSIKNIRKTVNQRTSHEVHFIPVSLFNRRRFCQKTGIATEFLPLLAAMHGNDAVSSLAMEGALRLKLNLDSRTPWMQRISVILDWLRKQTFRNLLDVLEEACNLAQINEIQKKNYMEVVSGYNPKQTTLECFVSDDSKLKNDLMFRMHLPDWFVKTFRTCSISGYIVNIWNKNFDFPPMQIENQDYPFSFLALKFLFNEIRGLLWATLFRSHQLNLRVKTWNTKPVESLQVISAEAQDYKTFLRTKMVPSINWYIRVNSDLQALELEAFHVDKYLKLPTLFEVEYLPSTEKRELFFKITNCSINFSDELPGELEFMLYITCFWYLTYKERANVQTLFCKLISYVTFFVINNIEAADLKKNIKDEVLPNTELLSVKQVIESLTKEELDYARHHLNNFKHAKYFLKTNTYDLRMQTFSEFIACFDFLTGLNSLLNCPYPVTCIEKFWNGTLCYNLHEEFGSNTTITEMLTQLKAKILPSDKNKKLVYLFKRLYSTVAEHLPIEKLPQFKQKETLQ